MKNLFAYGTLLCEDIMSAVTGSRLPSRSGTLLNYRRRAVRGADYPGVVACAGASVTGRLYCNLTTKAWQRLDRFEGEMYRRGSVRIELEPGAIAAAEIYVVKPAYVHRLDTADWDFAAFLERGKAQFLLSGKRRR